LQYNPCLTMAYYVGWDGGGTKTECVILDAAGNELGRGTAGASNAARIGANAAFASVRHASRQALEQAKLSRPQIRAACAGLAGAGSHAIVEYFQGTLAWWFSEALIHVTTDLEVALEAAVGEGPGVVLVAGTGSAAYGRNAAGNVARAGGYGPWVGDEGSAFDVGRRAVADLLQSSDGLAAQSSLHDAILAELGTPTRGELAERIAQSPDGVFPKLFPLVARAGEEGDSAARAILHAAAEALGRLAASVVAQLGLKRERFVLAKSGGVFGRSAILEAQLGAMLADIAPAAQVVELRTSPAVGAALLAARLAGSPIGKKTHASPD
jgi:N-acetylglucosamine kinase-like BadF-type ATPase